MRNLIIPLIFFIFFSFSGIFSLASSSDSIPTTVKIGICGDGVAEGFEECDNYDLSDETCVTLGYLEGELSCTPSCNFDKNLCIPIPEPEPEPTEDDSDDGDDNDEDETSENRNLQDLLKEIFETIIKDDSTEELKKILEEFDINSSGELDYDEILESVKKWVGYWRNYLDSNLIFEDNHRNTDFKCDLNFDQKCDLVDFSILMYHVDRE